MSPSVLSNLVALLNINLPSNFCLFFRDYHSCAVFQSAQHNYRPVAIVAGGWVEDGNYSSTEILDFTVGNAWTNCKLYLLSGLCKGQ